MTGGLVDDLLCREERGYVDQTFILKQIGEKVQEKKCRVYVGFIDFEKAYNMVNREALWRMHG